MCESIKRLDSISRPKSRSFLFLPLPDTQLTETFSRFPASMETFLSPRSWKQTVYCPLGELSNNRPSLHSLSECAASKVHLEALLIYGRKIIKNPHGSSAAAESASALSPAIYSTPLTCAFANRKLRNTNFSFPAPRWWFASARWNDV